MATFEIEPIRDAVRCLPVTRYVDTIFIPLPVALWRPCDAGDGCGCICDVCQADGSRGYWDTLAVAKNAPSRGHNDFTWTVHHPALHDVSIRKARAAEDARGANLFCISDAELAEERALLSPAELAAVDALPKPE